MAIVILKGVLNCIEEQSVEFAYVPVITVEQPEVRVDTDEDSGDEETLTQPA